MLGTVLSHELAGTEIPSFFEAQIFKLVVGFAFTTHSAIMLWCMYKRREWIWLVMSVLLFPLGAFAYYQVIYDKFFIQK